MGKLERMMRKHATVCISCRIVLGKLPGFFLVICDLPLGIFLGAVLALPLSAQSTRVTPLLVVHGGVDDAGPGQLSAQDQAAVRAGITRALTNGYAVLKNGGSSLDAVEAALRTFEDDTSGEFDAGRGAVVDTEGVAQLDAAIMDGQTLQAGSVAAVEHIAHPISLARMVMERTHHVMLVGPGAEAFAKSQGIDLVPNSYFITESRRKKYEQWKTQHSSSLPGHLGTTGAIALDVKGNLAAGTTTGGTSWKLPGRVDDSPILGAGTYASNALGCAVSSSGTGEFFMRDAVAADICHRVAYLHQTIDLAANFVIHTELKTQGGEGGVIVLDRTGHFVSSFNTHAFWRGSIGPDGKIEVEVF
jgi:L-asparaginase / beta-aspartyl-peptidase